MNSMQENRIAPEWTLRFAVSHFGLLCLPMSHKKDARLIWKAITKPMEGVQRRVVLVVNFFRIV